MKLEDYEIDGVVTAQYFGECCFDKDHVIRKNDRIFKPRRIDNPFATVYGFGCKKCLREMKYVR